MAINAYSTFLLNRIINQTKLVLFEFKKYATIIVAFRRSNIQVKITAVKIFFSNVESALKTSFCHFERSEKSYILNKNNGFPVALLLAAKAVPFSATE